MNKIMIFCFVLIIMASGFFIVNKKNIVKMDNHSISIEKNLSNDTNIQSSDNYQVENKITEIDEARYVGFINDLYENPNDYKGLQFRIRGHYRTREIDGIVKHYIFQGTDERWVGLEIVYADGYPTEGSIIQVVGIIKVRNDNEPYFDLTSMIKIRGGKRR